MVLTGWPATLTAPLEMIQAPGWPGTAVAETEIVWWAAGYTFACAASIVAIVWLGRMRFGRIHSGVMSREPERIRSDGPTPVRTFPRS